MKTLVALLAAAALCGCRGDAAFGGGGLPLTRAADDRAPDLAGTDQPAPLTTAEDTARAATAVLRIVDATAQVFDEVGSAVGDLFPSEDNPCPGGGSASSELSGSLNRPRLRMEFHDCVRGDYTLDGVATITCEDFDGDCTRGDAVLGENGDVLWFESREAVRPRIALLRGQARLLADPNAERLEVIASLEGEVRALGSDRRYSLVTRDLHLDLRDTGDDRAELRIEGTAGTGGGAVEANCAIGQFDTATPAEPLQIEGLRVVGGGLRLHSPPPRPGTEQGQAAYAAEGGTFTGADRSMQNYGAADLAAFCSLD